MGWDDAPPDAQDLKSSAWDATPPQPGEIEDWSDLKNNIIPDAENIGKGAMDQGLRIAKGAYDIPTDLTRTVNQVVTGGDPLDTPIAQDVKTVGGGAMDAIKSLLKSIGNLGDKQEWIQHPVGNTLTAASLAAPGIGEAFAPEGGLASSMAEGMRNKGASLANDLGEVSASTVKKINPRVLGEEAQNQIRTAGGKPNIADIRTQVGKKLIDDKIVGGFGQDVGDRLQKVNEALHSYGQQVDDALSAIKKTNRSAGEYPGVDDPLHVQANPILKPILDTAVDLGQSARSGIKQTARFWRETYNSLSKKAAENGDRLTLDDIRSEMQDVGKDMKGGVGTPRYETAKDIYGHLAETRDVMVNDIAQRVGNPELAKNLLDANKGYSFYSKIADGLQEAGAGGEVPEKMGKHIVRSTMRGDPMHATGYLGLMKFLNAVEPVMAEKLPAAAPIVERFGGPIEKTLTKGTRNSAILNHILGRKDENSTLYKGGQVPEDVKQYVAHYKEKRQ
jgi:hypothetical protein